MRAIDDLIRMAHLNHLKELHLMRPKDILTYNYFGFKTIDYG